MRHLRFNSQPREQSPPTFLNSNFLTNKKRMERKQLIKRFSLAIIIFIILILTGAFVYHSIEGWTYFDSLYFTVITITTIGYGDFVPQTISGKTFTMIFPFIGIGMAFYLLSVMSKYVFRRTFETHIKQHLKLKK